MPAPPDSLRTLAGRYDPAVFDAPARVRLCVGDQAWDAVLDGGSAELSEPDGGFDAVLAADAGVWKDVAADVRGGLDAFRRRRLSVRRNLHVGVGFLFVWGRRDKLVPIALARHVSDAVPGARHLELDCGHVPQLERPRETHAALAEFFAS